VSRKIAAAVLAALDGLNAVQPRQQRGKTIANVMAGLEARGARTVTTAHGELKFLTHRGRHVGGAVDNFFGNEPETLAWIDAMTPGEVLWDVGGAFGQFALYAGRRGLKVIAFEPKAPSYGLLVEHIALNGLGEQVTALPLALSDKPGLTGLHLMDMTAGSALNTLQGSVNQHGQVPQAFLQPVIATTLDAAAAAWDLPRPDHIKLDVDGVEAWILRGGPEILKTTRTLLIEMYGEHAAQLEADVRPLLEAAGLREDTAFREEGSKRNWVFRRA
jgi:FkbM family methyltransferase